MNKRLDYMTENYKKVLSFAVKITKNKEIAEDILQDLVVYFITKPKSDIDYWENHINYAVKLSYYGYFNKWLKRWAKSLDSFSSEETGEFNLYDYLESDQDLYKDLEKKMILEKMLDEYENICYPKQREALEFVLEHGHYEHPENNYETMKSNRRHAVEKLSIFADLGEYTDIKGKKPKNSKRRTKKELENAKTDFNF